MLRREYSFRFRSGRLTADDRSILPVPVKLSWVELLVLVIGRNGIFIRSNWIDVSPATSANGSAESGAFPSGLGVS